MLYIYFTHLRQIGILVQAMDSGFESQLCLLLTVGLTIYKPPDGQAVRLHGGSSIINPQE